ncbi:MAG TPA: FHA domain-containing protein [Marmoricola sp.]
MPQCTRCGSQQPDDARFCSQCGNPIEGSSADAASTAPAETTATISLGGPARPEPEERVALNDDDAEAVAALPDGSALLVVLRGPGAGSRYLLDTDVVTAGRHPDSDIFLDDITVSRRHVEFRRDGDGFTVHDVGSLNGTYLNRDRVDDASLSNGDEVRIGKFRLNYFVHEADGNQ